MSTPTTKLSKQQLADLATAERTLSAKLTDIDKLEQCGIDCQQLRSAVQGVMVDITNLRTHFGARS